MIVDAKDLRSGLGILPGTGETGAGAVTFDDDVWSHLGLFRVVDRCNRHFSLRQTINSSLDSELLMSFKL